MSKEERQVRSIFEEDIVQKIQKGHGEFLHLPAIDALSINRFVKGDTFIDIALGTSYSGNFYRRSLQYIRDAFEVDTTEQAVSMLIARGYPLPNELVSKKPNPQLHKGQLEVLKLYVEGETHENVAQKSNILPDSVSAAFTRMKDQVGAANNMQLVAVAVREGFLQPQQHVDGSFIFEINTNPSKLITERHKKILALRFAGQTDEQIGNQFEKKISASAVRQQAKTAREMADVATDMELLLHCLKTGQIESGELLSGVDLEVVRKLPRYLQELLEITLKDAGKHETNRQIAHATKGRLTHMSVRRYKKRIFQLLGVKRYLQALIMYKAAVERGIILPYEEAPTSPFPSSGVIYAHDNQ